MRPSPSELDQLLHSPKRLVAISILDSVKEAEFTYLKKRLEITESDLSKQMSKLVNADIVKVRKTGYGRNSSTWYSLTTKGKKAYRNYITTLKKILNHTLTEHIE